MRVQKNWLHFGVLLIVAIGLASCGPSRGRYAWQDSSGKIASYSRVSTAKKKCSYSKKMKKSVNQIIAAAAIARANNSKKLNKNYVNKAIRTMKASNRCMKARGLKLVKR